MGMGMSMNESVTKSSLPLYLYIAHLISYSGYVFLITDADHAIIWIIV